MKITPNHLGIKSLFDQFIFKVPKYQRTYAWTNTEISDFLDDVQNCYQARIIENSSREHFLGGIVSIGEYKQGEKMECELVDGQQRMATIVLFASNLIKAYKEIQKAVKKDQILNPICDTRINRLTTQYIYFKHEINRVFVETSRLELSGADKDFFYNLTRTSLEYDHKNLPHSHANLHSANEKFYKYLNKILKQIKQNGEKLDALERFELILQHDFSVLHMVSNTKNDAYKLFQVLNDRGKNLSTGDLLRAKTLELLENFQPQQNQAVTYWQHILSDSPSETKDFLNWYYASYIGSRPRAANLLKDFFAKIFEEDINSSQTQIEDEEKANQVVEILKDMQKSANICRKLLDGEWPYDRQDPITAWHRNRLAILILHLKHTNCMPLLLAAQANLNHKRFTDIVCIVERFAFRYITMCKAHATTLNNEYLRQAQDIRKLKANYRLSSLQSGLKSLQDTQAKNDIFEAALGSLVYNEKNSGSSNKPLKYLLITLEDYYQWYSSGSLGIPERLLTHVNIAFEDATLEHIYPKGLKVPDPELEPVKNSLGNITLLGADNGKAEDKPFLDKKLIYADCVITRDKPLSNLSAWTKDDIVNRQEDLIKMAKSIFSI